MPIDGRSRAEELRLEAPDAPETPAWPPLEPIAPGTRLGTYEILSFVGQGGMGQVYRARDARLDRCVAIKVLPPALAADPERRLRLEREAKAIASLNHPHICTLHDIGGGDGPAFLVMEYLEGETLAARLARGPLPLEEAVATATQIAEALVAAHKQGVVHRDLKPGNVMLTASGAKLLDFGLAKVTAPSEAPTGFIAPASTRSLTASGTIVGTLHYMAPEQLECRPVDSRTDIWAFGAVLYEMITGRRAFESASAAGLIADILQGEPAPLASLQPVVPPLLGTLTRACLAKDPAARRQTAVEIAAELRTIAHTLPGGDRAAPALAAPSRRGFLVPRRRRVLIGLGATALAVVAFVYGPTLWRSVVGGTLPPPSVLPLTTMPGLEGWPALSPDGRQLAFVWAGPNDNRPNIYLKAVGEADTRRLTSGEGFDLAPCWSPDGARIAFIRPPATILTISAVGGGELKVRDLPGIVHNAWALSWSPDKRWLAVSRRQTGDTSPGNGPGIYLVPVTGGDPVRVTSPPPPAIDYFPSFSWTGRFLAFARGRNEAIGEVYVQALDANGSPKGTPRKLRTVPNSLVVGLAWDRESRSLVVGLNAGISRLYRLWLDENRPPERIELAGLAAQGPATSSGSHRLAFVHMVDNPDVWRISAGGTPEPLIRSSFADAEPNYSPDGRRIVFTSYRTGDAEIWTADADGGNQAQLTRGLEGLKGSPSWSHDGRWVVFDGLDTDGRPCIYLVDSAGGQLRRLTSGRWSQNYPSWSHDDRWVYFRSDRSGRNEIWRAPVSGGEWEQMTTGGATRAYESIDGETLFYLKPPPMPKSFNAGQAVMAKPLDGRPERTLIDSASYIAVVERGFYYLGPVMAGGGLPAKLFFFDQDRGTSAEVARIASAIATGLAVSPDRRTFLYTASTRQGSDLMLIDNFR